jgi:HSP20 family protein
VSLIKWTPSWLDEFDSIFDMPMAISKNFVPAIDVYQEKDQVIIEAPLAGIDPEKVDISVEDNTLVIKGESEKKSEVEEKDYYRKEIRSGSFYRAIQLPFRVLGDKTEATYENGVLKVKISKAPETKAKSIKVKVNKE